MEVARGAEAVIQSRNSERSQIRSVPSRSSSSFTRGSRAESISTRILQNRIRTVENSRQVTNSSLRGSNVSNRSRGGSFLRKLGSAVLRSAVNEAGSLVIRSTRSRNSSSRSGSSVRSSSSNSRSGSSVQRSRSGSSNSRGTRSSSSRSRSSGSQDRN